MGTPDLSAAHVNGRNYHLIHCQPVHQHTDRCNISHRVHGANFMKVYLRHRDAVGMAFRLRNQRVHCHNVILHPPGQGKMPADNVLNIMQAAVMMGVAVSRIMGVGMVVTADRIMVMAMIVLMTVIMSMVVTVGRIMAMVVIITVIMPMVVAVGVVELMMVVIALFLFTVYRHGHVGSCNTTFHGRFLLKNNARNPKPIEFPHKFIRIRQQLQQRCCQHIACRPHSTVKI